MSAAAAAPIKLAIISEGVNAWPLYVAQGRKLFEQVIFFELMMRSQFKSCALAAVFGRDLFGLVLLEKRRACDGTIHSGLITLLTASGKPRTFL